MIDAEMYQVHELIQLNAGAFQVGHLHFCDTENSRECVAPAGTGCQSWHPSFR